MTVRLTNTFLHSYMIQRCKFPYPREVILFSPMLFGRCLLNLHFLPWLSTEFQTHIFTYIFYISNWRSTRYLEINTALKINLHHIPSQKSMAYPLFHSSSHSWVLWNLRPKHILNIPISLYLDCYNSRPSLHHLSPAQLLKHFNQPSYFYAGT